MSNTGGGSVYFVGWDVGPWKCRGESRDAFAFFRMAGAGEANAAKIAYCCERRGNASEWIANTGKRKLHDFFNSTLTLEPGDEEAETPEFSPGDAFCLAVDAALGWPAHFLKLLTGGVAPQDNASALFAPDCLLYRETERLLAQSPLSAVQDRIGAQSTKAMLFVRNYLGGNESASTGVWEGNGAHVIETYPRPLYSASANMNKKDADAARFAAVKKAFGAPALFAGVWSRVDALMPSFDAHRYKESGDGSQKPKGSKSVVKDRLDAVLCAAIAAAFYIDKDDAAGRAILLPPKTGCDKNEGWIWLPRECYDASGFGMLQY